MSAINESGRKLVTNDFLKVHLEAALAKQTVRMGGLIAAIIALATTVHGVLISIK